MGNRGPGHGSGGPTRAKRVGVLSIIIALLFAAGGFAAGRHWFGVGSGVLLGVLGFLIAAIVLIRLVGKRFGASRLEVEGHIRAQRVQKAIASLEALRPLGLWHPMLRWSLEEQIGILRYAGLREIDEAQPYLQRARFKSGQAWAMLAASFFKRGRQDEAERVFQTAMKRRPKERLVWAAYVWCALKRGRKDAALEALGRARARPDTLWYQEMLPRSKSHLLRMLSRTNVYTASARDS